MSAVFEYYFFAGEAHFTRHDEFSRSIPRLILLDAIPCPFSTHVSNGFLAKPSLRVTGYGGNIIAEHVFIYTYVYVSAERV